jgi:uncharacterized protein (UPF0264 family)
MERRGPQLLVSVRDAAEARAARDGGADWIDLKEPRNGALGAVDAATAREVADVLAGRASLSAAGGELVEWRASTARGWLTGTAVSHVKLGLAGCAGRAWQSLLCEAHGELRAAGKQPVGVIYADHAAADAPTPDDVLAAAIDGGCAWVLWDTFDKTGGGLTAHLSLVELSRQLATARGAGLRTVVAGRLELGALPSLPLDLIDMVAVRGAACRAGRDSDVCCERVAELRAALARHTDCVASSTM